MHYMKSLDVKWFFALGARCPPETVWQVEFPSLKYTCMGPKQTAYNGVLALSCHTMEQELVWESKWSSSPETMWVRVGSQEAWCGFVVPPRQRGRNEERRRTAVKALFEQVASVKKIAKQQGLLSIRLVGDVNPSDDIDAYF